MTRTRWRLMAGYAAWMACLITVYYSVPSVRIVTWGVMGASGVAAIIAGTVINQPARRLPWFFLAGANLSFAAGEIIFVLLTHLLHGKVPYPSIADVFYLAAYPLYAAGLIIFVRWRTAGRDRRSLLDALTITAGLALLSWIFLIQPYAQSSALSWLQKTFSIAYPLGDVLVLTMLLRLLAPGSGRSRSVQLLTLGSLGLLVSDVLFGLIQLHGTWHIGTPVDIGWAFFYGAWGAAALHPSMVELTQPVSGRQTGSPLRLVFLMFASLIAPAVLFVESRGGRPRDAAVIAVFSAVLYMLVLSRLADVATSYLRAQARERSLREAGVWLAAVTTVNDVASVAADAVHSLIGPRSPHSGLLAVRDGETLLPVAAAGNPARIEPPPLPQSWISMLTVPGPQLIRAAELGAAADGVTAGMASHDVLLCPLLIEDRRSGDPLIGALIVFAGQRHLAALSGTLDTLARQVALAIERITLADESDRLRAQELEANRLRAMSREVGLRIRQHLSADEVLHEARIALEANLDADVVNLRLLGDEGLGPPIGRHPDELVSTSVTELSALGDTDELRSLFYAQTSRVVQDEPPGQVPAETANGLDTTGSGLAATGAAAHIITPFGVGRDLIGVITAHRLHDGHAWTSAEVDAVESIAADLGRGLNHARLYEAEGNLVESLKTLAKDRTDFFAMVSHELRSPLTIIEGYWEVLSEGEAGPVSAMQRKILQAIRRSNRRLKALIDDLFTLAKLESSALETVMSPVSLADVVTATAYAVRPSAEAAGVTLSSTGPETKLMVSGDASQLDRLLINLLSNAVKFTPKGGHVEVSAEAQDGNAVVQVSDTGIGIPEGDQGELFTRFFRAANAKQQSIPGTGLGLVIVKRIVDQHNGDIRLVSRVGAGTTFTVRLPLLATGDEGNGAVGA